MVRGKLSLRQRRKLAAYFAKNGGYTREVGRVWTAAGEPVSVRIALPTRCAYSVMLCLCVVYYKLEKKASSHATPLVFIAGVMSQSAVLSPSATVIYTQTPSEVGETRLMRRAGLPDCGHFLLNNWVFVGMCTGYLLLILNGP
jgi:hypothetical protein